MSASAGELVRIGSGDGKMGDCEVGDGDFVGGGSGCN